MINVSCPHCDASLKISQPKQGKFKPRCKQCRRIFQLLIKQAPDGSFKHKSAPLPSSEKPDPNQSAAKSPSLPRADETRIQGNQEQTRAASSSSELDAGGETRFATTREDSDGKQSTLAARPANVAQATNNETRVDDRPRESTRRDRSVGAKQTVPGTKGRLGVYQLLKLLGQGGMGSVYLAKQTSLDRNVALKVVKTKLASNPSMLARFTREAYAAAQLVHPNVVQIYDMGDEQGNCYFSMELVDGMSLHELIGRAKKLDPEQATSYILHAARGLQCAHDAGMVHRDIKPANLLVNRDGLVKVADLGLVKVPDADEIEDDVDTAAALSASQDLTRVGAALGTPYYMAPEQAKSSINVDHRADIYSLGCTFYVLLTGKRPFEGGSYEEVVSKHSTAPLVIPSRIVERVPHELSAIVAKMMAKRPEDRYQNMCELIRELERYLGINSTAAFTPEEADADVVEVAAKQFNATPLAKFRGLLPLALLAGSLLLAAVMLFVSWRWATGFLLLPLSALATHFLLAGFRERGPLFERSRELVVRSGWLTWLKWGAAALLLLAASLLVGTIVQWLVLILLGAGLGAAYYFAIDLPISNSRKAAISQAESLLRKLRLKGMDEMTLQMFAAKYSGHHWEEFFESLFGYEAKRRIRAELAKSELGKKKPKFRAWRDSLADGLDRRIEQLATEGDKRHLQKVEQANLQAAGLSIADAKIQAAQMAEAIVDHGDEIRIAALQERIRELDPEVRRIEQRQKIKSMLAEARSGKYRKEKTTMQLLEPKLDRLLGGYPRFMLGCFLVLGCLLWARQNGLLEQLRVTATEAQNLLAADASDAAEQAKAQALNLNATLKIETDPLSVPLLGSVFWNFNSLIAGLILLGSTIVFGWRMAIFSLPAAVITLWGSTFGVPELIPFDVAHVHLTSALIGVGLVVVGFVFGRAED